MNRYRCNEHIESRRDLITSQQVFTVKGCMEAAAGGEWVKFTDAQAEIEYWKNQIPSVRIERLEKALGLVNVGKCPECEQPTRDYKPPLGSFAPEAFATLREHGIDPGTGHKIGCTLGRKIEQEKKGG